MSVACYKNFSIDVTTLIQGYWAMEDADPLAQSDSTGGPDLVKWAGSNAQFTKQIGLIGACEQFHPLGPIFDGMQTADVPALKFNGLAFTITVWINFQVLALVPGLSNWGLAYFFDQNGINYTINLSNDGTGNWTAGFNGIGVLNKPDAAGWHFLVMTYNGVSGNFGFDVDQSGMIFVNVGVLPAGPNVSGVMDLGATLVNLGEDVVVQYDELALFNQVLSAARLNYLYNAGAGRTWPIVLP